MNLGICKHWWILAHNYSIIPKDNKVSIIYLNKIHKILKTFYLYREPRIPNMLVQKELFQYP